MKRALNHVKASPANRNSALISGGAIRAPGVDFSSVEISPCKLSAMNSEEEVAPINLQHGLAQDSEVGIDWRKEFAEALPDEGGLLEDA